MTKVNEDSKYKMKDPNFDMKRHFFNVGVQSVEKKSLVNKVEFPDNIHKIVKHFVQINPSRI